MKGKLRCVLIIFLCMALSCTRTVSRDASRLVTWSGAYPLAILQTGENPLWFQLTEEGPVHINAVEDAVSVSAFVPWPHALHIRFFKETSDGITAVVNGDGFLKLAPGDAGASGLFLYRFPGGDFWRQYTVGGFVFYDELPAAVLYLEDRFLSSDISSPWPRTWSFNMNSNSLFSFDIPFLRLYPEEEGWNVDTLRLADDGFIYYRVARRDARNRMFRTSGFDQAGDEISAEVFFNSAPRQTAFSHPSLPLLPEGFVYTGIGLAGDSLFASWEEQTDYSIGAAGFVVIKP